MRVMEQLVYVLKCFLENWRRKYSLKSKHLMERVNFRLLHYIYDWSLMLTALAGLDYEGISENISFSTGSSPGNLFCFNLTILDDEDPEESEYFNLTITSLSPGVIMNTSIIEFHLADDDSPPFNGRLLLHENTPLLVLLHVQHFDRFTSYRKYCCGLLHHNCVCGSGDTCVFCALHTVCVMLTEEKKEKEK